MCVYKECCGDCIELRKGALLIAVEGRGLLLLLAGSPSPKRAFALFVSAFSRLRVSTRLVLPQQSSLSLLLARLLTSLVLFEIKSTQYSSKSNNWANALKMANLEIAGLSGLGLF
jgi:hypothetical protein